MLHAKAGGACAQGGDSRTVTTLIDAYRRLSTHKIFFGDVEIEPNNSWTGAESPARRWGTTNMSVQVSGFSPVIPILRHFSSHFSAIRDWFLASYREIGVYLNREQVVNILTNPSPFPLPCANAQGRGEPLWTMLPQVALGPSGRPPTRLPGAIFLDPFGVVLMPRSARRGYKKEERGCTRSDTGAPAISIRSKIMINRRLHFSLETKEAVGDDGFLTRERAALSC